MLTRLEIAHSSIKNFALIDKQLSLSFLKRDKSELKANYGLEFLIEDIENLIIQSKNQVIIFHSFNHLFDLPDGRIIEPAIQTISEMAKKHDKRILFTCDTEYDNYKLVSDCFSTHADLTLTISDSHKATRKKLNISYSIFPVEIFNYQFSLVNATLSLEEKTESSNAKSTQPGHRNERFNNRKSILLLSNNQSVIGFHEYLLSAKPTFKLNVCNNPTEVLAGLLSKPELIIVYCQDIEEHRRLASTLEESAIGAELIFLVDQNYIREEDRIRVSELYNCNQIFSANYRVVDYILAIEKSLGERFYPRVSHQGKLARLHISIEEFNQQLKAHKEQKIFYCVHHFKKITGDTNQLARLLRGGDSFFIDDNSNCWIICLNSQAEDAVAISTKMSTVGVSATLYDSQNLLEILSIESEVAAA